jgi:hypothetical protein
VKPASLIFSLGRSYRASRTFSLFSRQRVSSINSCTKQSRKVPEAVAGAGPPRRATRCYKRSIALREANIHFGQPSFASEIGERSAVMHPPPTAMISQMPAAAQVEKTTA